MKCYHCNTDLNIKRGLRYNKNLNIQRYYCKVCEKSFTSYKNRYIRMRNDKEVIDKALELRKTGLSYEKIAKQINKVSRQTIFKWRKKYKPTEEHRKNISLSLKGRKNKDLK